MIPFQMYSISCAVFALSSTVWYNYVARENTGEFGKLSIIRQYFTYQYFPLSACYNLKIIIYWRLI